MNRKDIPASELAAVAAFETADDVHRSNVETLTVQVLQIGRVPVYDVHLLEPLHFVEDQTPAQARASVRRAVEYLDARGLLFRPVLGHSELVSFYAPEAPALIH